ncbi:MAG TPA: PhaM family polyhydroxyalkanoate granule multifunctional regulatory protein [Casimicrobiaceae bacterium]|nr:PhaM family polyhydroxyalkanoate granule multifunctional regulatory protein [Casimicrobiaceae bacterium]
MSADSTKPPPGGGASPFSAQDAIAFMQKLWNPFGLPMPGLMPQTSAEAGAPAAMPGMPFPNPAAMFAALDPAEVERKINELRIIEGWLAMSLNMMQMSIKTMELQKASLEAMRAGHAASSQRPQGKG